MRITLDEQYAATVLVGLISPWTPDGLVSWADGLKTSPGLYVPPGGFQRLEGDGSPLAEAIDAYGEYLVGKGREPKNARLHLNRLRRAGMAMGWKTIDDLTFASVTEYLASKQDWSPRTRNWNVSNFRSFGKWLRRTERWPVNYLEDVDTLPEPAALGARAASTHEARQMVSYAASRNSDKRARGCRALYYATLFLSGARASEPVQWQWRDLMLDREHPTIHWRPEVQKNGHRAELLIAPELVGLLRKWREYLVSLEQPVAGEAPVFPVPPSHATWRTDRDRLGIPAEDDRGRGFSHHSARKWFATTLTVASVPSRMVDRLMRHTGRSAERYFDPSEEEQAAALQMLPPIWPEEWPLDEILTPQAVTPGVIARKSGKRRL